MDAGSAAAAVVSSRPGARMNSETNHTLPIRFSECTWRDLDTSARDQAILILPVGSTEAHGPHLPLETDVLISEAMAAEGVRSLRASGLLAFVLPAIAYSVTDFAVDFTGSISIRCETARDVIADIGRSLFKQGFRRMCIANSHLEPRHVDSIVEAIAIVRSETGIEIAFPDTRRRKWAALLTDEFRSGACHAGRYEGSVVLAVRPDLVRDDIRATLPPVNLSLVDAIRDGKTSFVDAGGELAYFGEPAEASIEEGRRTVATLAEILVQSIQETFGIEDGIHREH
jgi:creatinine amidohydrolase